jgi:hypothetical protein
MSGRIYSLYFGASFAPRMLHAASQIHCSSDLSFSGFVARPFRLVFAGTDDAGVLAPVSEVLTGRDGAEPRDRFNFLFLTSSIGTNFTLNCGIPSPLEVFEYQVGILTHARWLAEISNIGGYVRERTGCGGRLRSAYCAFSRQLCQTFLYHGVSSPTISGYASYSSRARFDLTLMRRL